VGIQNYQFKQATSAAIHAHSTAFFLVSSLFVDVEFYELDKATINQS